MAKWLKFGTLRFGGPGLRVQIPDVDLLHSTAMLGAIPHTKRRKPGTDVSSGRIFLTQTHKLIKIFFYCPFRAQTINYLFNTTSFQMNEK